MTLPEWMVPLVLIVTSLLTVGILLTTSLLTVLGFTIRSMIRDPLASLSAQVTTQTKRLEGVEAGVIHVNERVDLLLVNQSSIAGKVDRIADDL